MAIASDRGGEKCGLVAFPRNEHTQFVAVDRQIEGILAAAGGCQPGIREGAHTGAVEDYRRELDLATATARTEFTRDGIRHVSGGATCLNIARGLPDAETL